MRNDHSKMERNTVPRVPGTRNGRKAGRNKVASIPPGTTWIGTVTPAFAKVSRLKLVGTQTSSIWFRRPTQSGGMESVSNMVRMTLAEAPWTRMAAYPGRCNTETNGCPIGCWVAWCRAMSRSGADAANWSTNSGMSVPHERAVTG